MKNTEIALSNLKVGDVVKFSFSKLPYLITEINKKGLISAHRERITKQKPFVYDRDGFYINTETKLIILQKQKYSKEEIKKLSKFINFQK